MNPSEVPSLEAAVSALHRRPHKLLITLLSPFKARRPRRGSTLTAKYTIATDGVVQSVRIKEMAVPAEFLYQATPKLDAQAYLMAHIMDWEELDLISGRLRIYFEDDFVGESTLALNLASDTLSLSLGPDPAIQVRRKLVKGTTTSPTSSQASASCERDMGNHRGQPQATAHSHRHRRPTSPVQRRGCGGQSREPRRRKTRQRHGACEWDITVKPSERKNIRFKYGVQAPRERPIGWTAEACWQRTTLPAIPSHKKGPPFAGLFCLDFSHCSIATSRCALGIVLGFVLLVELNLLVVEDHIAALDPSVPHIVAHHVQAHPRLK